MSVKGGSDEEAAAADRFRTALSRPNSGCSSRGFAWMETAQRSYERQERNRKDR
jgi:hypothetical protein